MNTNDLLKSLLSSKRFLAAAISVAIVLLNERLGLGLSSEQIQSFVITVGGFIVSGSLRDYGSWSELLKSKRFLAFASTIGLVLGNKYLGLNLTEAQVQGFVIAITTAMIGDSLKAMGFSINQSNLEQKAQNSYEYK